MGNTKKDTTKKVTTDVDIIPQESLRYALNLYTEEFSNLNPTALKYYIEYARQGFPFYSYSLFETVRQRDPRIGAGCQRRKSGVLGKKFVLKCENKEMKKIAEKMFEVLGSKLTNFIMDIVEANIQGCKFFEINYDVVDGYIMPVSITGIGNHLYLYNDETKEYSFMDIKKVDGMTMKLFATPSIATKIDISKIPQIDIVPEKVLQVFALDGDSQCAFMNGSTISMLLTYFMKSYIVKDMHGYIERHASPTIIGKYNALNTGTKKEVTKAVQGIKNAGSVTIPKDEAEIEYLKDESGKQSADIYLGGIKYHNSEITIRLIGEEETTQMGNKGSMAALKIKEYVAGDISSCDLKLIEATLNAVIKVVTDLNTANAPEYAKVEYPERKDLEAIKKQTEIYKDVNDIGFTVDKNALQEQIDIPITENTAPPPVKNEDKKFAEVVSEDEAEAYNRMMWESVTKEKGGK